MVPLNPGGHRLAPLPERGEFSFGSGASPRRRAASPPPAGTELAYRRPASRQARGSAAAAIPSLTRSPSTNGVRPTASVAPQSSPSDPRSHSSPGTYTRAVASSIAATLERSRLSQPRRDRRPSSAAEIGRAHV